MTAKITTPFGHALPPAPRHAISTHIPTWSTLLQFVEDPRPIMGQLKSFYPRMKPHPDIVELAGKITASIGVEGHVCLLFPSSESAEDCKAFATSGKRGKDALSPDEITIRVFQVKDTLNAVFIPAAKAMIVMTYWQHAGTGISSRMAESNLEQIDSLHEVTGKDYPKSISVSSAHAEVQKRIVGLLERAPLRSDRARKVSPDDVYLYQSGMASIYYVQRYLMQHYNATNILFGFAFHSTSHIFEDWDTPPYKFFGLGTEADLAALEDFLENEKTEGRKVQAVWCEFPANPLVVTPDLKKLRKLADQYEFLLVVDDTIAGFCNVDLLDAAAIIITSLTKSFNGYADLLAASAVLSPVSPRYEELKDLFSKLYHNDFYSADAEALERNSRDYLQRSAILNNNATRLVEYLHSLTTDPNSCVKAVHYPTVSPSGSNYTTWMRLKTDEFTPGYGCLFNLELDDLETAAAFYDNLNVHIGPHFGAHLALAMPYIMGLYGKQLDWAAKYEQRPTQIRMSVGLEDTETLLETFKHALVAADNVKAKKVTT